MSRDVFSTLRLICDSCKDHLSLFSSKRVVCVIQTSLDPHVLLKYYVIATIVWVGINPEAVFALANR